ncbi:hypothetical protein OIU78_013205 [Salix suchowensis]|nr:hypothetical protein OIU78_013205 [Salix suchowensis]
MWGFDIFAAIQISKDGMKIEYIDISPLPVLNTDLEVDVTELSHLLLKLSGRRFSKLIVSSLPHLSTTIPSPNAIDWASRPPNCWSDKASAIVSMELLTTSFTYCIEIYLDLHFINKPEFHLNAFAPPAKFDSDGNLIDPQSKNRLKEVLLSLFAFTSRLKGNC